MRLFRTLLAIAAVALLGFAAFVVAARSGWLQPGEAELRARYGLPGSHYVMLGGQQLHYADEGSGPAIVLVHGSYASLRQWQAWADALNGSFRVIRFDRPGMGLSGPSPEARYDGDAEAALILKFADRLKLDRFVLAGTSSSGEGVAHFAAQHPQRVQGLILANIAAGPIKMDTSHLTPRFKRVLAIEKWLGGWHMQAFWDEILHMNFADPTKVTPALVREWTELNNRAQGWPHRPRAGGKLAFAGTPDDLRAITAPTLLLWTDGDHETSAETHGQQTLALLASADKQLSVIAHCGHMLPQECGGQSAAVARPFLDKVTSR